MIRYIKSHPLAAVIIVALLLRLTAAIFSQGFIHSDDHYDSVDVAYFWLQNGLWNIDGGLSWKEYPASTIGRFPLYTMFLFGVMKLHTLVGITALDKMMYTIRFLHALISLLPVWVVYQILRRQTGRVRWAVLGGLMVALHFGMPFLGVRNLIEMVGGNIWIGALYFFYRYRDEPQISRLYLAGLLTGLAWMIRFQLAFAALPIPFILWYEYRSIRPAIHYSAAVAGMLLFSGIIDYFLVGRFASSTINNLMINTGLGARYVTVPFVYMLVILGFFIPPFSLVLGYLSILPSFWRRHRLLVISTLAFIVFHMLHSNQQERFMLPIIPALFILTALALWHRYQEKGYILKNRKLFLSLAGISLIINLLLIIPFTTAYGHKGLIEPLIWIERMEIKPRVMFVQPDMRRWIPISYSGFKPPTRLYIRDWPTYNSLPPRYQAAGAFDLFVLYPQKDGDLELYLDSLQSRYGQLEPLRSYESSLYDKMMHSLNAKHYQKFEPRLYRPRTQP
ncbi:MAG: hypothetical protein GY841_03655 [FCB group bacterium]|nr:hypothetical protein [FCB group bacterium]